MSEQTTTAAVANAPAHEVKKQKNLNAMQIATLAWYTLHDRPKQTAGNQPLTPEEEVYIKANVPQIPQDLLDDMVDKGVLSSFLFISPDGKEVKGYEITKFGVKWCRTSESFGNNFNQIIKSLSLDAKIKFFLMLVDDLKVAIGENLITKINKKGEVSGVYGAMQQAAATILGLLAVEPKAAAKKK